jgi:hypothetical protein
MDGRLLVRRLSLREAKAMVRIAWIIPSVIAGLVAIPHTTAFQQHSECLTGHPAEAIQQATLFCIGGFGIAAQRLEAELALCTLLHCPDAASECERLLPNATPEGKMYLLYALYRLDCDRYTSAKVRILNEPGPAARRWAGMRRIEQGYLAMGEGCTVQMATKEAIISSIEAGAYDRQFEQACAPRTAPN